MALHGAQLMTLKVMVEFHVFHDLAQQLMILTVRVEFHCSMALHCAQLMTLKVMLELHVVHDSTRQLPFTTLKVEVGLHVIHDPTPQLTTLKVGLKCYLVLAFVRVCEIARLYFQALVCCVFKCITFKKERKKKLPYRFCWLPSRLFSIAAGFQPADVRRGGATGQGFHELPLQSHRVFGLGGQLSLFVTTETNKQTNKQQQHTHTHHHHHQ